MKKSLLFIVLFSITLSIGYAQSEIYFPPYQAPTIIERTSVQKGIGVSTDIVAVALPVAALAGVIITQDWEGLKQAAFTAIAATGASFILKFSVRELRPDNSNFHSFPSFHSASSFATAAFLQRRYGWKFGAPAYALATYTAIGRVVAKKHHWWDCVVGAAIGAGSAYIFTRPWAQQHDFAIVPMADEEHIGFAASITF